MSANNQIVNRFTWVLCLFALLTVAIAGKILWVQNTRSPRLDRMNAHSVPEIKESIPHRGDILARDGTKLAFSVPTYRVFLDFQVINSIRHLDTDTFSYIDNLAQTFSKVIGDKSAKEYRDLFIKGSQSRLSNGSPNQYFPLVVNPISYEQRKAIQAQCRLASRPVNKGGVLIEGSYERKKPYGNIASRTIGNIGEQAGLDRSFNAALAGQNGLIEIKRDFGWNLPEMITPVRDGYDITTTLDIGIQQVTTKALTEMMVKQHAQWGCAVVMNVHTGEVLAIANIEKYKNGSYAEGGTNYATNFRTQPGSTFKLASMIALLEDGHVTPQDSVNTGNGSYHFPGTTKTYKDTHANHWLNPKGIIANSSNIGTIKLVSKTFRGRAGINAYMDRIIGLGLNNKLGLDIEEIAPQFKMAPGVNDPIWYTTDLPSISIGYVSELAPIQMLALYNAIANGGKLVRPRFVNSISSGKTIIKSFGTKVIKSAICSQKTVAELRSMLEAVVKVGTAKNICNKQYSIAGKTGTIELTDWIDTPKGRVSKDEHQASFCGYYPAENPLYSCIVVVNRPQVSRYGGTVAAVVFKQISDYIYLKDPAMHSDVLNQVLPNANLTPTAKNGYNKETVGILKALNLPVKTNSAPDEWVKTKATAGSIEVDNINILKEQVPNVVGMGAMDALYCLEKKGIEVTVSGYGTVVNQSIAAGTKLTKNMKLKITLE